MAPFGWKMVVTLQLLGLVAMAASRARDGDSPRVLMVQAHPDDETQCAATLFSFAHNLGGVVDVAVVTDGQGGYNCSELASLIYGYNLTDETVGRAKLPSIRQQEMLGSAAALGIHEVFFLYEPDVAYTLNVSLPLEEWWNATAVLGQLQQILSVGGYDLVVVMLPDPSTHGEHKAATILALEAVAAMPDVQTRPLVAGCAPDGTDDWAGSLAGYPITATTTLQSTVAFNRSSPVGSRLDYHVAVDLALAQHRSQGCLYLGLSQKPQELEEFWSFSINPPDRGAEFEALMLSAVTAPYVPFGFPGQPSEASEGARVVGPR